MMLAFVLAFSIIYIPDVALADMSTRPKAVVTGQVVSSKNIAGAKEYFKVSTPLKQKYRIYVSGRVKPDVKKICIMLQGHKSKYVYIRTFVTPNKKGEFSIRINTKKGNKRVPIVLNNKGKVTKATQSRGTCPGYIKVPKLPVGDYHLLITAAVTEKNANVRKNNWKNSTLTGAKGYIYKEALLKVRKGNLNNPKLVKYDNVIKNNRIVQNSLEKKSYHINTYTGSYPMYKDVYVKDISFIFRNPKTDEHEYLTRQQVDYIDKVAAIITKGCNTKYQKAQKIYEYVGKNTYYDNYALSQHTNQYSNPYKNLYNLRNKKKSANSINGKIAVTCQGYAGMVLALARAEGIPARFIKGSHIRQPNNIWSEWSFEKVNTVSHYWCELYLNGRWVVADARPANSSKWVRNSFSDSGRWIKEDFITYAHFDPTDIQYSNSYVCLDVMPGSREGKFINRKDEVTKLQNFLDFSEDGSIKNGKLLNENYKASDFATWGNGKEDNFLNDGYGKVKKIDWNNEELCGKINLSNFDSLYNLKMQGNNITDVNLENCDSLKYISFAYNNLTSFDCDSTELVYLNLKGNKLAEAAFNHNNSKISIGTTNGGTFAIVYNSNNAEKLTINAHKAPKGYKFDGIYNQDDKLVTNDTSITFNPKSKIYTLKYIPV